MSFTASFNQWSFPSPGGGGPVDSASAWPLAGSFVIHVAVCVALMSLRFLPAVEQIEALVPHLAGLPVPPAAVDDPVPPDTRSARSRRGAAAPAAGALIRRPRRRSRAAADPGRPSRGEGALNGGRADAADSVRPRSPPLRNINRPTGPRSRRRACSSPCWATSAAFGI